MTKGTITTLVIVGCVSLAASSVSAQPPADEQAPPPVAAPQPPPQEPGWLGDSLPPLWNRVFVNINAARQLQTGTFNSSSTFDRFGETAEFATTQNVGLATMFDASGGYRFNKHLAVGGGVWTAVAKSAVAGTAALPDPLVYGQYATKTLLTEDLHQKTIGVNLQLIGSVSIGNRLDVSVFIGPTLARVKLDVGSLTMANPQTSGSSSSTSASSGQNAAANVPTPAITIESQSKTTTRAATAGFDVTFMFTERYGVGLLARYVRGDVNLPIAPEMKIAGTQVGVGLRYRF